MPISTNIFRHFLMQKDLKLAPFGTKGSSQTRGHLARCLMDSGRIRQTVCCALRFYSTSRGKLYVIVWGKA
jgi:hypothetical protein